MVFECGVGDDRALKNYPVDDFSEGVGLPRLPNPPSAQKKTTRRWFLNVESEGFEPSSKQVIQQLSTRLVLV